MPLKDRFRRAIGRTPSAPTSLNSSRSTSNSQLSTSTSTSPPTPSITLTKTTSTTARLTKSLTWRTSKPKQDKREKALEEWEKYDHREWVTPSRVTRHKSKHHQDILRGFEINFGKEGRKGSGSIWSGVSPGQSRRASWQSSRAPLGQSALSRVGSRTEARIEE
ncbi:hypothetical protein GLAREA_11366 [Glarea lozoyensis ATCC 20868]|uniref:Uncharacterized protein n=1 Tax=Glarea lozoyensis (strain ATCC 20868 / MF5171) TaxID=1116229 RepID=S3DUN1_GLAL2|nr:uncharacterized protein GLAREA_11366 [Glarea lozoyensis ATCC 20868]EPE35666.1 hypothetical protein GLAREA_11366 [Glarea lozoyensis ATCC 20868]